MHGNKVIPPKELLEEWKKEDEEMRRIRREKADWDFINRQPPHIKTAYQYRLMVVLLSP